MNKKLKCIMLIDDNKDDNFFHEREIKKNDLANVVVIKNTGLEGLTYLKLRKENKDPQPDLIFLDINMPGMNGWDFLQEYNELDKELQSMAIIVMLTTSENPADEERAKNWDFVSDYVTKPLTKQLMKDISQKYFI